MCWRVQVSDAVCRILGAPVDPDIVLMAAGLDSLGSVELVAELEKLGKIDLAGESSPKRVLRLPLFFEAETMCRRCKFGRHEAVLERVA